MKLNLVFILIFGCFNYIFSREPELLSISVYENSHKKDTYNITLINPKFTKIIKDPSKLAYITDINNKDSIILDKYTKFYNRIWLFFINDIEEMKKVIEKKYESKGILITGILIPESLDYHNTEIEKNERFPIFTIKGEMNKTLINYDIRNNKKNVYFIINYTENLLINFFIIFSSFALVTAIVLGIGWNYLEKKVGPIFIFSYHEKIKYILCAHIFLSLTLIFKTISIMKSENYELTVAVEISLYLSISFFRSLLWFLIYLISSGWNICFQELALNEQKKIFRLFIFIAILFFIDDILDKYCGKLWVLNVSEIKNILLFSLLIFLSARNIIKNLKILRRKYSYALVLLRDYADGINEKIKIMERLRYNIFLYLPFYLLILIINKSILFDYENQMVLLFTYLIPDFFLEFSFTFLMRPKKVPIYFGVDLGDIFNEVEGQTYICALPKYDEFNDKSAEEKINDKNYYEDENMPIIVIGPEKSKNNSFILDDNSDKSDLLDLDINRYFSNIQVGYCKEEE